MRIHSLLFSTSEPEVPSLTFVPTSSATHKLSAYVVVDHVSSVHRESVAARTVQRSRHP
ncbi:E3 ubiquitin-protein ligase [Caligus rogercresseyi]|uniref:E3 ubiquitin-protein ligase n=1 Tax=Caligus rogercresseyi TaxID=217165 RepID=A0A7T8GS19_CALRO|nr:E3 ubiquitin-protein ligase [Caligus rogercresseyi]